MNENLSHSLRSSSRIYSLIIINLFIFTSEFRTWLHFFHAYTSSVYGLVRCQASVELTDVHSCTIGSSGWPDVPIKYSERSLALISFSHFIPSSPPLGHLPPGVDPFLRPSYDLLNWSWRIITARVWRERGVLKNRLRKYRFFNRIFILFSSSNRGDRFSLARTHSRTLPRVEKIACWYFSCVCTVWSNTRSSFTAATLIGVSSFCLPRAQLVHLQKTVHFPWF